MRNTFFVTSCRFHTHDSHQLVMIGYFRNNKNDGQRLEVFLDGRKIPCKAEELELLSGAMRNSEGMPITKQYFLWITLPDSWLGHQKVDVIQFNEDGKKKVYHISVKKIEKLKKELPCRIDKVKIEQGCFWLRGWYICEKDMKLSFMNQKGEALSAELERESRPDIQKVYPECMTEEIKGFTAVFRGDIPAKAVVLLESKNNSAKISVALRPSALEKTVSKAVHLTQKAKLYYQKNGIQATWKRVFDKVTSRTEISYEEWFKRNRPSAGNLKAQRNMRFAYAPLVSIIVSGTEEAPNYLQETKDSIHKQSYQKWEMCFCKGNNAESMSKAMGEAKGEWIAFVHAGDVLSLNALYECVSEMNAFPATELIYTDEDKLDDKGKKHIDPNFKPDYNIDMLRSTNYIKHLLVVKRELCQKAGNRNPDIEVDPEYDFILRCVENTDNIRHIPKVLYSERKVFHDEKGISKMELGAIRAHYNRVKISAEAMETSYPGIYRSKYRLESFPLVSVIIPNKDHIEDLDKCLKSLGVKSSYPNIEYIVVENNSQKEETFAYYQQLETKNPKAKVVFWEGKGFNYPAINMYGVEYAQGEYLLFLNNDTEIVNEDCIEELLGYCMRDDVGAAGARLYYEDGSIQHAGVIIGLGGVAAHAFVDTHPEDAGYANRIVMAQDLSAVTAACMMVKRTVFERVGGFDTSYAVAFNDVDLCLKIREAGYLIVYNPYAELMHYESKSRGYEDTPEKVERFQSEIQRFHKRWEKILEEGDPYYNPNLTLDKCDFSLSIVSRRK